MALLGQLQRVFENTYDRSAAVDLEACVVGPRRCRELVARSGGADPEMSSWARFFYSVEKGNLRIALFFGPEVVAPLEAEDPRRGIGEANVVPFLVLAEEASHALHTSFAFAEGGPGRVAGPDFPAELEMLARVDAYLVLRHFVEGHAARFGAADRAWVRRQALTRWDVPYDDPALAARYRGAARGAARWVDHLDRLPAGERLAALRRFRALTWSEKRARIHRRN